MDGYCAACGKRAPSNDIGKDAARLVLARWRVRPSVPLQQDDVRHWILLCPNCAENPSPAAQQILQVWKDRKSRS